MDFFVIDTIAQKYIFLLSIFTMLKKELFSLMRIEKKPKQQKKCVFCRNKLQRFCDFAVFWVKINKIETFHLDCFVLCVIM